MASASDAIRAALVLMNTYCVENANGTCLGYRLAASATEAVRAAARATWFMALHGTPAPDDYIRDLDEPLINLLAKTLRATEVR